jgi:hypothetical protein
MEKPRTEPLETLPMLPPLPGWIVSAPAETPEAAAFRSGAALAHLGQATASGGVPLALWRDRLALAAAGNCAAMAGRREGQGALRDALHLTGPGDDPGPAGRIARQWSRAAARPVSVAHLVNALEGIAAERIALCLDATGPTPVDRAAQVVEAVLTDHPQMEVAALILADAALARALGATHVLPLLALTLKPRDLRVRGDDLRLACHRAVVFAVGQALPLAGDLARASARLQAVAPKLRAKAAGRAVDLFLSRDALAPAALTFMSDRAARRLCDRLVSLGAARELTGRDTFRLYGL